MAGAAYAAHLATRTPASRLGPNVPDRYRSHGRQPPSSPVVVQTPVPGSISCAVVPHRDPLLYLLVDG